jgi:pSer/pThr/pTyr-binding forkhead associated (FHA) protein
LELILETTQNGINLYVKDLQSRFGSYINDMKLPGEEKIDIIETDTILKLGAGISKIHITKVIYSFCMTRLEKPEKDRLKVLSLLFCFVVCLVSVIVSSEAD